MKVYVIQFNGYEDQSIHNNEFFTNKASAEKRCHEINKVADNSLDQEYEVIDLSLFKAG